MVKDLSKTYVILEGFGFFTAGIIASLVTRKFIKKRISFNKFQYNDLKIVAIPLLIGGAVLFILLIIFSSISYYFTQHETLNFDTISVVSTLVNSFIFIFFWLLIYILIKISRQFRKNKIEKIELEFSLKESQLNTLIGQVNPHFMFNSLNNIKALMLEDVAKSRDMITRLSDMLRYSLTQNNKSKVTISKELEMVENYIELSSIQLEDRLEYKTEIDTAILAIEIPPMIIQMLVENAIKHGISNLPKGGLVMLKVLKKNEQLIIRVCNSGKLVIDKNSTNIGIKNIKNRLSLMYGEKADFTLKENDDMVTAMIKIPLI